MALKPITGKDFKRSRSFKDISLSFLKNPFTKDVASVSNEEAIKQSIKNIVLTSPGEKFFNPNFGSKVSTLLFEQLDPFLIDSIRSEILNTISNYEKRVKIVTLKCIPDYEDNAITVYLEYQIIGLPLVENLEFILKRP